MKKIGVLFLFITGFVLVGIAQTKTIRLFHIERSMNRDNFVAYDANLKNGVPDPKKPVIAYWGWFEQPSHREDLTMFDKIAYGFSEKKLGNNEYNFTLRASSKKVFHLCKHDGKWMATTKIGGTEAQVIRLYVKMKSAMKAEYLDIFGKDLATGKDVKERLK